MYAPNGDFKREKCISHKKLKTELDRLVLSLDIHYLQFVTWVLHLQLNVRLRKKNLKQFQKHVESKCLNILTFANPRSSV